MLSIPAYRWKKARFMHHDATIHGSATCSKDSVRYAISSPFTIPPGHYTSTPTGAASAACDSFAVDKALADVSPPRFVVRAELGLRHRQVFGNLGSGVYAVAFNVRRREKLTYYYQGDHSLFSVSEQQPDG